MNTTARSPDNMVDLSKSRLEMISVTQLSPFSDLVDNINISLHNSEFLLVPLLVAESENGQFHIIDGFKRWKSVCEDSTRKLPCNIVSVGENSLIGLLRIHINAGRVLSLQEKILFLKWLKSNVDDLQYRSECERIGINAKERYDVEKLVNAASPLINAVQRGILDMSNVSDLIMWNEDASEALLDLFSKLQFSRQTQRELIEWIPELSERTAQTINDIISLELFVIILDGRLNPPQKVQRIRDRIYTLRFPLYSKAQEIWKAISSKVNPDQRAIKFEPCPGFEKNRLDITVTITEPSKAIHLFSKLAQIHEDSWTQLLCPSDRQKDKLI